MNLFHALVAVPGVGANMTIQMIPDPGPGRMIHGLYGQTWRNSLTHLLSGSAKGRAFAPVG